MINDDLDRLLLTDLSLCFALILQTDEYDCLLCLKHVTTSSQVSCLMKAILDHGNREELAQFIKLMISDRIAEFTRFRLNNGGDWQISFISRNI